MSSDAIMRYLFLYNDHTANDMQRNLVIDRLGKEDMKTIVAIFENLLGQKLPCPKSKAKRLLSDYVHVRKLLQKNGETVGQKLSLADKKNLLRKTNGLTIGWLCRFCCCSKDKK